MRNDKKASATTSKFVRSFFYFEIFPNHFLKPKTMRKILILLLLSFHVYGQTTIDDVAKSVRGLRADHPRLLISGNSDEKLALAIKKHPEWNQVHQSILAECDKILNTAPVEHVKIGKRLLDKSRECLRRVFYLSYAYRMTKEAKYLNRAEKELLAVSQFSDWNPSHFLDTAEMTMAVAIGYDWLFEALPESTRAIIKMAIIEKGINPSYDKKFNWFLQAENNWNQVCNAGMVFGALAIAENEPELATKIIYRAVQSLPVSVIPSYQPDGAYPEGFGYWDYGTSFNVLYIAALDHAFGTDFGISKSPGFLKTGEFMQQMMGPIGLAHNWGDSGIKEGLNPALFWFASKTKMPSLLWNQKKTLKNKNSRYTSNRILPSLLIWGAETDLDQIQAPNQKIWVGQGPSPVAMMRTSWVDSNAIYVGVKAGSPSVNHAHMDVGSFVLDANGERWASDFGMQDYNSLETKGVDLWNRSQDSQRWQVFRLNNLAHNTLTFDNQLQRVKGYAKIDQWSTDSDSPAVVMDLSEVYGGQVSGVKRGIAIRDKKYVVVRDEIRTTEKSAVLRWNLLTTANVKIVDGKTVQLSQNGKSMFLTFDTKAKIEVKTWSTTPTHDYDAANPGTTFVGFETTMPANTNTVFNAFFSKDRKVGKVKELVEWSVK